MQIIVKKPAKAEIDSTKSWGDWSHGAGQFDWSYSEQETCLILSGKAEVVSKDGKVSAKFSAGDWVVFPIGLVCTWKISEEIKKKYKFG